MPTAKRCTINLLVRIRTGSAKASAYPGSDDLRYTAEQRIYRHLESLADAVMAGRVKGKFVEVKGETTEELYKEFFG